MDVFGEQDPLCRQPITQASLFDSDVVQRFLNELRKYPARVFEGKAEPPSTVPTPVDPRPPETRDVQ